jgi:hypothetical protein
MLRLDAAMIRAIRAAAAESGETASALVRRILAGWLASRKGRRAQ